MKNIKLEDVKTVSSMIIALAAIATIASAIVIAVIKVMAK